MREVVTNISKMMVSIDNVNDGQIYIAYDYKYNHVWKLHAHYFNDVDNIPTKYYLWAVMENTIWWNGACQNNKGLYPTIKEAIEFMMGIDKQIYEFDSLKELGEWLIKQ